MHPFVHEGVTLLFYVQATSYLNKLPDRLAGDDRILVVDPMLATGKAQVILPPPL